MQANSPLQGFREPRTHLLRIDPLLLLASIALVGCGIYLVGTATQDDIAGSEHYYVYRQAAYAGVGIVLMLLLSRFDYSRSREWKAGLYLLMIGAILLVYAVGVSARGSKRAIELGFMNLQSSELGKVLLILSLGAFALDRMRRSLASV